MGEVSRVLNWTSEKYKEEYDRIFGMGCKKGKKKKGSKKKK